MSRDWKKDMELVENFKHAQKLCNGIQPTFHGMISMPEPVEIALEYWLQQYAAEKERGDQAEAKAVFWEMEYYALQREYNEYRTIYPPAVLEEGEE